MSAEGHGHKHLQKGPGKLHKDSTPLNTRGKQKRGMPEVTWWRTMGAEMKEQKRSWGKLKKIASHRHAWRTLVTALYSKGVKDSKLESNT